MSTRSVPKSPAHQQQAFQYASPVKASGGELATGVMSLPLPQSPVAAERAVSPVSPTSRLQAVQPPFPPDVYDFLEVRATMPTSPLVITKLSQVNEYLGSSILQ